MKLIISLLMFLFVSNYLVAQRKANLVISMGDIPREQLKVAEENKTGDVHLAPLIDGRYIDPDRDELIDSLLLVSSIKSLYPDSGEGKIGILDWEGQTLQDLLYCDTLSSDFKIAIDKFNKLLRIAKDVKPKVRWGIYHLPFTSYWQIDSLKIYNSKILSLLDKCDILMPSLYSYYATGTKFTFNEKYFKLNTLHALEIAHLLKKEVYAFVWNRWHESNKTIGLKFIPEPEFASYITWILSQNYKDRKVSGLVWFGAEGYYYPSKKNLRSPKYKNENRYLNILLKAIKSVSR